MKLITQYITKSMLRNMQDGKPMIIRVNSLDLQVEIRLDEDAKKDASSNDLLNKLIGR